VLDPTDDAAWGLGACVEVQDERPLGLQIEGNPIRCRVPRRLGRLLPLHAANDTVWSSHVLWNGREIEVIDRLETGYSRR
jgi:hypothetical protein